MNVNTYSFSDVTMTISHPALGQCTVTGEGIGSINITMATDRTTHDIAADGSVMVSKIKGRNGAIGLSVQQISSLNKWMTKWYNYLETAATSEWAKTSVTVRSPIMGETIKATGVSPQKLADKPYQAQGQQINWNLMAADIQQEAL